MDGAEAGQLHQRRRGGGDDRVRRLVNPLLRRPDAGRVRGDVRQIPPDRIRDPKLAEFLQSQNRRGRELFCDGADVVNGRAVGADPLVWNPLQLFGDFVEAARFLMLV